jgi:hypothetical protein
VFDDLANRISRRRLALLAERKLAGGGKPLGVDEIVFYFMEPYVLHEGGRDGALLISMILHQRVSPTPTAEAIVSKYFDKVAASFVAAFADALPHLDKKALWWRYYFMVSTVLFAASERGQGNRLAAISGGRADLNDLDELVHQLTMFIAGGVTAPVDSPRLRIPASFADNGPVRAADTASKTRSAAKTPGKKPATIAKKTKGETDGPLALRKRTSRSR